MTAKSKFCLADNDILWTPSSEPSINYLLSVQNSSAWQIFADQIMASNFSRNFQSLSLSFQRLKPINQTNLYARKNHISAKDARKISVPLPYGSIAGKTISQGCLLFYCSFINLMNILSTIFFRERMGKHEWISNFVVCESKMRLSKLIMKIAISFYWKCFYCHIVSLHGLADNCDSFAPLAPLLSPNFHYIALDAVGHGQSSHPPLGTTLNFWDLVIFVRRTVQHLKLPKVSILGHSMGGSTGLLFASLYPDNVERLLLLDIVKPVTLPLGWHTQSISEAIDQQLELEKRMTNPKLERSFTIEELVIKGF